ncbi:TDT family transporter [Gordonia sp. CPCC 205515]|uniref:TDT family transporter n=1 Tax=Gordonia sp. CPCC 205515 TaxID=3140791 RepID=UPI003AF3B7C6
MTATLDRAPVQSPRSSRRFLADLDSRGQVVEHLTPNWFAAVMGTGIVANAAAAVASQSPVVMGFATVVWLAATALLLVISVGFATHWVRHPDTARSYAAHPVMSHFYGALPMAILTVGAGTVRFGPTFLGSGVATAIGFALWGLGTAIGLFTTVWVPYAMITQPHRHESMALPAWLMPIVPPMVSAATGAALIDAVPAGQARLLMLAFCYALFGLSLILGMTTMTLIYARLVRGGVPTGAAAPTIWITLGMIGQSITAVNLLAAHAGSVFTGDETAIALGLKVFGIVYGLAMGGFGCAMFTLATCLTVRAFRRGLPFALTWWSFTFPIGTCVTGLAALGVALNASVIHGAADVLYVVLVVAWAVVATRTARGVFSGRIFLPA